MTAEPVRCIAGYVTISQQLLDGRYLRTPSGWRIVHADHQRGVYTLERSRRFFKGAYRVMTREDLLS